MRVLVIEGLQDVKLRSEVGMLNHHRGQLILQAVGLSL
jgi:hypothetical protein